jgi:hypothetical protein
MNKRNVQQRCAIEFYVELNENVTETYKKLKGAYEEHDLSKAQVFKWRKAFWMTESGR